MRGFITEVADALYRRYGDDISSLRLVFPNRRAQLFFCDALSSLIHRPLWQPAFVSIGELMERLSGLRGSDRVKLITELYKVYSRVHDESFDTFYFWGDMLLADFDQIDKYLIDADMLFSNIGDLKALEGDHSYLTDDQIRVIRQFWQSFGSGSSCSDEQRHFLTIWESLADIYHRFRESLSAQGLAYEGMVYRAAAERLLDDEAVALPGDADGRYVVVGFNALSACDSLIIPIQCEYYALEGLSQLVTTVRQVKRLYNPGIEIEGVLLTMYDGRLNLTLQVVDEVKKYFPEKVFKNVIPRNVRLSEAPSFGQPVLYFDRSSRGSQAYEALTAEILDKNRKG